MKHVKNFKTTAYNPFFFSLNYKFFINNLHAKNVGLPPSINLGILNYFLFKLPGGVEGDHTCRTFVFEEEGHTLGNALKCIISR